MQTSFSSISSSYSSNFSTVKVVDEDGAIMFLPNFGPLPILVTRVNDSFYPSFDYESEYLRG